MSVSISRVHKMGGSKCLLLPLKVLALLAWNAGDSVAIRITGSKLIAERVPVEDLARLKIATAEVERG